MSTLFQTVMGDRVSSTDGSDDLNDLPDITDSDLVEMNFIEQIFDEASRYLLALVIGLFCAFLFYTDSHY